MNHSRTRIAAGLCLALLLSAVQSINTQAATFRVKAQIFEGTNVEAAVENSILFDNGLVYELPQIQNRFVTVYDSSKGQVTLLDRQTQQQTTIGTEELVKVTAQVRAQAQATQQETKWGLNAQVVPSQRVIGFALKFEGVEYNMTTQQVADPSMVLDYGRFADLASRLNIVRRLGPPPFGRMTLHQHIASVGEVPLETTLSITRQGKVEEFRSRHQFVDLTDDDRSQIDEVRGMMAVYKTVGFAEFPRP